MHAPRRTGLRRLGCLAACALALAWAGPAGAEGPPWLRIDRVKAEPSVFEGLTRLQLFVTAVDLHGLMLGDMTGDRDWKLKLGSRPLRAPHLLGTFQGVDDELVVAIVIETGAPFADVLPEVKARVGELLQALPRQSRVLVLGYDDEVHGGSRVHSIAQARRALDRLDANTLSMELQLIEAVDQAREALVRARPETPGASQRKLMVVISDGKDADPTPNNYRTVSRRAGRQGIRIHTIGFPPDRNRYPLYGLAEMSKQSEGTFRLVLTERAFAGHFEQLGREILQQYVLTYYLPEDQIVRKRVHLEARDMVSEPVRVPAASCGAETCAPGEACVARRCVAPARGQGLGVLGWVLAIVGSIVGGLVVLWLIGVILVRAQRARAARRALAEALEAHGVAAQDPGLPEHRIVAQGPDGQPVHAPAGRAASHHGAPPSGAHPAAGRAASHAGVQRIEPMGPGAGAAGGSGAHHALPHGAAASGGFAAQAGAPSLLILGGAHQGKRVPLHHGFVIGTAPNAHLHLSDDRFASGHHAHILMDAAGGCTLVDRGSTNGTFVNGVRTREKRLAHGMLIKIGSTEARFLTQ